MLQFYGELKVASAQQALLFAQRHWIAADRQVSRYAHPFSWAAFVASGNRNELEAQSK